MTSKCVEVLRSPDMVLHHCDHLTWFFITPASEIMFTSVLPTGDVSEVNYALPKESV